MLKRTKIIVLIVVLVIAAGGLGIVVHAKSQGVLVSTDKQILANKEIDSLALYYGYR